MIRSALLTIALAVTISASFARGDEMPAPPLVPKTLHITAPSGWDGLPGLSLTVATSAAETDFLGDHEATNSGAVAYGRASQGALYLTWVDSVRTQPSPEARIRHAFDELHQAPYVASPEVGSTQEVLYRESQSEGVAEMRFEWSHMSNETVNILRALAWKDKSAHIHLAIAECVLMSENISESRPLCDQALDSLGLASQDAIAPLLALPEPAPQEAVPDQNIEVPELTTGTAIPGASLGDVPTEMGKVLYEGRPPSKSNSSNRFIIAIGVLLLGVAFWLTTRSPHRSEDEDSEEETSEGVRDASDDDDDDDKEQP